MKVDHLYNLTIGISIFPMIQKKEGAFHVSFKSF